VLLDRRLPDGEGLAVIPSLRRSNPGVPVIVLTALDSIGARVEGLDRGADDYIVKPFAFAELLARMRAALRRPGGDPPPPILCGGLAFDTAERTATLNGTPQVLTRRELALLEGLMLRVGRVVTRDALMQRIYGFDDDVQENTFDALVSRLRRRFAEQGAGVAIHTVRGIGYMIGPARP
jgi:DNA-binding response OmpR family regulator